jgi:hypothetical protein
MTTVVEVLESKVKQMCRFVAEQPHGTYHFEMGRPLAERRGYVLDGGARDRSQQRLGYGCLPHRAPGRGTWTGGRDRLHAATGDPRAATRRRCLAGPPDSYEFISQRARDASARYGVKSISLLAVKDQRLTRGICHVR